MRDEEGAVGAMNKAQVIISIAAAHYWMTPQQLLEKTNRHAVAHRRQAAMLVCRRLLGPVWSWPKLGTAFDGMHHTTILFGCRAAKQRLERDTHFAGDVETITRLARRALGIADPSAPASAVDAA